MTNWADTGSTFMVGLSRSGKSYGALDRLMRYSLEGVPFLYMDPREDNAKAYF